MLGDWGVKDSKGNWLEFRVGRDRALRTYDTNKEAFELYSNVDPADLSKAVRELKKN